MAQGSFSSKREAEKSASNSLAGFAYNITADKVDTNYNNALLEGTVNRVV
mgnify:CR=1 FL=1